MVFAPMTVTHEVASIIVDHNPFIEGMVFESAILPSLLLASKIWSIEASKL
jgi:hypothetical protein